VQGKKFEIFASKVFIIIKQELRNCTHHKQCL